MTTVRKLTQYVPLTREEFRSRFYERFYDPAFDEVQAELEKICERDAQPETFVQVENAATSLINTVRAMRSGEYKAPDAGLRNPRQK